jgi:hypothetical protein
MRFFKLVFILVFLLQTVSCGAIASHDYSKELTDAGFSQPPANVEEAFEAIHFLKGDYDQFYQFSQVEALGLGWNIDVKGIMSKPPDVTLTLFVNGVAQDSKLVFPQNDSRWQIQDSGEYNLVYNLPKSSLVLKTQDDIIQVWVLEKK